MPIVDYERIFLLLSLGKTDYFPRGLNEPHVELLTCKDLGLTVEKTLILQYPAPMYFFVNKQNVLLATRLEKGMLKAIEDGSFDKVFFNHPHTKEIFETSNLENRKIIRLVNPLLPPETPLSDKRLWYTPENVFSH